MSLFVGLSWDGYSAGSQTISELSAIGAPTRPLWVVLGAAYTALIIAFGWGVWRTASRNRSLRVVGALLVIQGVTDTLHIAWTIVTGLFFMLALGFGTAAFGTRFRVYSIATMAIVFACGAWTGTYASLIQANLPTPWAGVWERMNTTAFMVWVAVLAVALLRTRTATSVCS